MKPFYKLSEAEFRTWMANFVTQTSSYASYLGLQAGDLGVIQDAADSLAGALEAAETARMESLAATEAKDLQLATTLNTVRRYANRFRASQAVSDDVLIALGLPPHSSGGSLVNLFVPSGLIATAAGTGLNTLKWKRAGNAPGATFVIEVRYGTDGDWTLAGVSSRTKFEHTGNPVGTLAFYRVYAQRDGRRSDYSEAVTLYGAGGALKSAA